MVDLAAIAQEIDFLERVQGDLAKIASRDDDQRKHDLVELRRKLSAQIAEVGRIAEPFFAEHGDGELTAAFRAGFSRMRSAAAIHQANWPAVRLGEQVEEYRASAQLVRDANRDFVAWMRETLAHLGRSRHRA